MYLPQEDNLIAGASRNGQLPPGLRTADNASDLQADETPDSYGLDLALDGKVGKGTIPTGTTRITKTVTINLSTVYGATFGTAVPFLLYYGRLWNITGLTNSGTGTTLRIGAPNVEDTWLEQSTDFSFTEDANAILGIIPVRSGGMFVVKSTGSYMIDNVYDPRGSQFYRRSDMIQEMYAAAIANVVELDGTIYASNASGLISYKDGVTTDITARVRDSKTNYTTLNLKADYINKRIIASTDGSIGFVYDVPADKLYRHSASTFRWTTRQWHHPKWYQVNVDALKFVIEHGDTTDGTLTYQYRYEDEAWSDEKIVYLNYSDQDFTVIEEGLPERRNTYRFQVRLTGLSANKRVKEIRVIGESFNE